MYAYLFAHGTFPSAGKHFPFPNIPYPKPSEIVKIDSFLTRERVDAILNFALYADYCMPRNDDGNFFVRAIYKFAYHCE